MYKLQSKITYCIVTPEDNLSTSKFYCYCNVSISKICRRQAINSTSHIEILSFFLNKYFYLNSLLSSWSES